MRYFLLIAGLLPDLIGSTQSLACFTNRNRRIRRNMRILPELDEIIASVFQAGVLAAACSEQREWRKEKTAESGLK